MRAIAEVADVSPALVNHHFGSKQGVVKVVEEWVLTLLRSATAGEGDSTDPAEANARRAAAFEALLREQPLLRAYIRRMVLEESPEGLDWFAMIVNEGAADLRRREHTGMARPSADVHAVAAILNVLALGPLLLPRHLQHVLGGGDAELAFGRWQAAVSEILRTPLYPDARSAPGSND